MAALADRLNRDASVLSRPLTAQEAIEWAFYRASASQAERAWKRAQELWEGRGMTLTQAALVMRIDRSVVTRNTRPANTRGYRVFPYAAALRLARATGLKDGVMYFVEGD